jgi:hypothetical protein
VAGFLLQKNRVDHPATVPVAKAMLGEGLQRMVLQKNWGGSFATDGGRWYYVKFSINTYCLVVVFWGYCGVVFNGV